MTSPTQENIEPYEDYQDNEMFGIPQPRPPGYKEVPYVVAPNPQIRVGPTSCRVTCPGCKKNDITDVKYTPGTRTHLYAFFMGFFTVGLCCWVPYVCRRWKNADHYCHNCGRFIAFYNGNRY